MGLRDGEDMSLLHTCRLQNSTVTPKDLWVTDMVLLHNVHKVTLTFRKSRDKQSISQPNDSVLLMLPLSWSEEMLL